MTDMNYVCKPLPMKQETLEKQLRCRKASIDSTNRSVTLNDIM